MPDYTWSPTYGNDFGQPQSESEPQAEMPEVVPQVPDLNMSNIGDESPVESEPTSESDNPIADESDEASTEDSDTASNGEHTRRKKQNGVVPSFDRWAAKKIVDAYVALSTEQGAAAAKALLGATTTDPATLLSLLTEKKNRKRVSEAVAQVKELTASDDHGVLMMNLALAFSADKDLAKSLIGLFNAVAPEKNFSRSTGDPRKDAKAIADAWGDGIDLSTLAPLRF